MTAQFRRTRNHRAFTLVESAISILLVGLTLVASVKLLGMSRLSERQSSLRIRACALADEMLTEIRIQDYIDADVREAFYDGIQNSGVVAIGVGSEGYGPGTHEAATGNRSLFDDVDDYHGWSASPPQEKDGTDIANLTGWTRSVSIVRLNPGNFNVNPAQDLGLKQITVVVSHNGSERCRRIGIKSLGLPPTEACCLPDTSCVEVPKDICVSLSGKEQGWNTSCGSIQCVTNPVVLFVVTDPGNPTTHEQARIDLIDSWDFEITLIDDDDTQANFDAAAANTTVAYVSIEVDAIALGTKLKDAVIGAVVEDRNSMLDFGFCSNRGSDGGTDIDITNGAHYITQPLGTGNVTILSSSEALVYLGGTNAAGVETLATRPGQPTKEFLAVIEAGGALYNGGNAAGRRVKLPWSDDSFDFNALNTDGQTIMQRSIEWASGMDFVCGDATCASGEDACTCPSDCGSAAAFEQPGVTCNDGLDNDCDSDTDCADINCGTDPACSGAVCGNGTCESGENCNTCGKDCASKTNGSPAGRYCCGDGLAQLAEGDGTICDGNY